LINSTSQLKLKQIYSRIVNSVFGYVFACNLIAVTRARVRLQVRVYWKLTSNVRSDVYRWSLGQGRNWCHNPCSQTNALIYIDIAHNRCVCQQLNEPRVYEIKNDKNSNKQRNFTSKLKHLFELRICVSNK